MAEFGCGEGSNTRRFAQLGAAMTGIDLSASMLAHARAQEAREPLGIRYLQASFSDECGLAAGSFDAVVPQWR